MRSSSVSRDDQDAIIHFYGAGMQMPMLADCYGCTLDQVAGIVFRARQRGDKRAAVHGGPQHRAALRAAWIAAGEPLPVSG